MLTITSESIIPAEPAASKLRLTLPTLPRIPLA